MPRIDANAPADSNFLPSSMTFGVSRVGKTAFNASFPRPAFFCSEREGGFKTIQTMDRSLWYEANMPPLIYGISSMKEFLPYFNEVRQHIQTGRVKTIVLELSFYSDDVIRSSPKSNNGWAPYKLLEDHIIWLDAQVKQIAKTKPVRLAYNALAAPPDKADKGGIIIAGKALAGKLPAATDFLAYLTTEERNKKIERTLHLQPYGVYPAGHRYGPRLPAFVREPTFRKLEDLVAGRAKIDADGNVFYGDGPVTLPPLLSESDLPPLDSLGALPLLDVLSEDNTELPPLT